MRSNKYLLKLRPIQNHIFFAPAQAKLGFDEIVAGKTLRREIFPSGNFPPVTFPRSAAVLDNKVKREFVFDVD